MRDDACDGQTDRTRKVVGAAGWIEHGLRRYKGGSVADGVDAASGMRMCFPSPIAADVVLHSLTTRQDLLGETGEVSDEVNGKRNPSVNSLLRRAPRLHLPFNAVQLLYVFLP